MVTLDQVKLLETRVEKAIGYVERVGGENAELREKLDSYQKRIDELEVLVQTFREDQSRIEDGILSTLDRLNRFEDAIERTLGVKARNGDKTRKSPKAAEPPEVPPDSGTEGESPGADPAAEEPSEDGGELDIF
ncbi:MAG: cell division protein ZapB [Treponema sp.]|jgi:chromosome segregation ATPase|nr:cell division protein ZapB [Treponema sp.]